MLMPNFGMLPDLTLLRACLVGKLFGFGDSVNQKSGIALIGQTACNLSTCMAGLVVVSTASSTGGLILSEQPTDESRLQLISLEYGEFRLAGRSVSAGKEGTLLGGVLQLPTTGPKSDSKQVHS